MSQFEWLDKYALGIVEIDAQHQLMVQLARQLADAVAKEATVATILAALDELKTQTEAHFREEEDQMERSGYPAYSAHKELHDRLLQDLTARRAAVAADARNAPALAAMLEEWLFNHMLSADKHFAKFAASRGSATMH